MLSDSVRVSVAVAGLVASDMGSSLRGCCEDSTSKWPRQSRGRLVTRDPSHHGRLGASWRPVEERLPGSECLGGRSLLAGRECLLILPRGGLPPLDTRVRHATSS